VTAAQRWLVERGCTSMTGPWSFTPDDEPGVQVAGEQVPGVTGRPWHPPHLAQLLVDRDFVVVDERRTWRLPVSALGPSVAPAGEPPGQAGAYVDRRLVLDDIAAVPDLAEALRTSGLRSAWSIATRARRGDWELATVVRCTGDPAVAVPALQVAAGEAGYHHVIAPWSPDPSAEPEAVHRTLRLSW
jgi:hypothetical protein